jgi:hypothetical protein
MEMSLVAIFVINFHKKTFGIWHLGIKDFQCEDCGKQCTLGRSLKQHVNIFHLQLQ